MARAEKQCEKCRWFEWARDMNATIPYCNLKHEYEHERCKQYGTLEDVEKRIEQLEQLCRDLYLIYMEEFVDYAGFTARMNDLGIGIEGRTRVGR